MRRFGYHAALAAAAICVVVIAGWILDLPILTSFAPDLPRVRVTTALVFLLAVASLMMGLAERGTRNQSVRWRWRVAGMSEACGVLVYGLVAVTEYFLHSRSELAVDGSPGLMTPLAALDLLPSLAAAISLVLLGIALLTWRHPRGLSYFYVINGSVLLLAWVRLAGLFLGVRDSGGALLFKSLYLPSTVALLLIAIGLFCLRPAEGITRLFSSPHHAGRLARRLVPIGALVTLGFGATGLWAQARLQFSTPSAVAAYGTAIFVALSLIGLRGAVLLDRLEQHRRRAELGRERVLAAREQALRRLGKSEARLVASEQQYRSLLEFAPDAIVIVDTRGAIVIVNSQAEKMFGYTREELLGMKVEALMPERFRERHPGHRGGYFESPHPRPMGAGLELYGLRRDGAEFSIEISLSPLVTSEGTLAIGAIRDITERKQADERLRESEERFRGAFEHAPIGMAMVSLTGQWMRVNRALCHIVGRTEEELLACTFQDITHPDDLETDLNNLRALLRREQDHYSTEKRYIHKAGHIVWVLLAVTVVLDAAGAPLHFVTQVEDITVARETAARMQASLEEKEVLLGEIHHRVKNNMQVITSMLQLQSGYVKDPQDAAIFADCQARIQAMALVHDRLYRSGNFATIDFSAHLREIIALIVRGQSGPPGRIRVIVESEGVQVNLDTAIPLGLIVAELITNAYKHAFPDGRSGAITACLVRTRERELTLTVEDDGVGMPAGFEPERARSLGLRLIRALGQQLRGNLSIAAPETGSRFTLAFSI